MATKNNSLMPWSRQRKVSSIQYLIIYNRFVTHCNQRWCLHLWLGFCIFASGSLMSHRVVVFWKGTWWTPFSYCWLPFLSAWLPNLSNTYSTYKHQIRYVFVSTTSVHIWCVYDQKYIIPYISTVYIYALFFMICIWLHMITHSILYAPYMIVYLHGWFWIHSHI